VGLTSSTISLMSQDGTTLASTAVGTAGGALEIPNPLPATGTYTILVRPGGTYTGNMTLTLSTEVSDSLKINAAPRQIMISRVGQCGRYTFSGTAGQQVTIKATNNKFGNVMVNLYTPSGVLQAGATSSASTFNLNPVTLATTDTYTITINPAMTDTGSIHLQVVSP
jgi:ribosome-associated translation inhibitor RaiA